MKLILSPQDNSRPAPPVYAVVERTDGKGDGQDDSCYELIVWKKGETIDEALAFWG